VKLVRGLEMAREQLACCMNKALHHSRLERLSAYVKEAGVRFSLPNDLLFKVDMASTKKSLGTRVPMLDEDLFASSFSLSHRLKVQGRTCKRVLRAVADR
jgi:asparagine synthase (glutamine-hydrolysing)